MNRFLRVNKGLAKLVMRREKQKMAPYLATADAASSGLPVTFKSLSLVAAEATESGLGAEAAGGAGDSAIRASRYTR